MNNFNWTNFDYKKYTEILSKRRWNFKDFPYIARNHKSVCKYALKVNINNIFYMWNDMYENMEVLKVIMKKDFEKLWQIIEKIENKSIFKDLICINANVLKFKEKIKDKKKMIEYLKINSDTIRYADSVLLNDNIFISEILIIKSTFINLHKKYLNDIELVKIAIACEDTENFKMWIKDKSIISVYNLLPQHIKNDEWIKKLINLKIR